MNEFDRVFDGNDVPAALGVDLVDHRGERGALARTSGAGHEHEATRTVGESGNHRREIEIVKRLDVKRNATDDYADAAALLEHVAAKTGQIRDAKREVELVLQFESLLLVFRKHRVRQLQRIPRRENMLDTRVDDIAIDPQLRPLANGDVQVGGPPLDHFIEQGAQRYRSLSGISHRAGSRERSATRRPKDRRTFRWRGNPTVTRTQLAVSRMT